ncbi:hypothetical protein BDQ12DRAFT_396775 [Crucibulum laeve]|uniref:Uncharacterized protein n=1 Tax=Crucibulum laeve TaxID=68775 RepID=A0A5C3MKY3_9AGAR|nr:hypothetical protein BDQ12DRAFT_396775 [Crucibulum laeve]
MPLQQTAQTVLAGIRSVSHSGFHCHCLGPEYPFVLVEPLNPTFTVLSALVKLHYGGDVMFPGHPGRYITVDTLRGPSPRTNVEGDIVLHRLLVDSIGRPLWGYSSEKELLQGIRAALSARQLLCG